VVNEVTIGPSASFARESEDALISSRVKIALADIDIPGFDPTRIKVVTEEGTVFLMGLVYPREGDAAAQKARYVPGVAKVAKVFEYIEP
jgi:osmotically-inducible protein OsmY